MPSNQFTNEEIEAETQRLYSNLKKVNFSLDRCRSIAPLTLEINQLKRKQNAAILVHSYCTPDIIYGIADFTGDSYGLSKVARDSEADIIIFAGVIFMAETAKILNPSKRVFIPSLESGCSLADSITAANVRELKKKYPGKPVVCYVNTTAEVKAECDVCVTSANVERIIERIPEQEIIFVPDIHMGNNVELVTNKKLIKWQGKCEVHDEFTLEQLRDLKRDFPEVKILVHSECNSAIAGEADLVGGTSDMIKYVKKSSFNQFVLITECGLSDRMRVEFPTKEFLGMCNICPYMKKNTLFDIIDVLKNLPEKNEIHLTSDIINRAVISLDKMFELAT